MVHELLHFFALLCIGLFILTEIFAAAQYPSKKNLVAVGLVFAGLAALILLW